LIADTQVLNLVNIVFQDCCIIRQVHYLRNEGKCKVIYVEKSKFRRVRVTIFDVERQNITYSVCVSVALFIEHAKGLLSVVTCGLYGIQYILHCHPKTGTLFKKKNVLNIKYAF